MKVINRKAKYDYKFLETFEAGVSLTGAEVKAVKKGMVDLKNSYAKVLRGEAFLINAIIQEAGGKTSTRTRRLLLHKKEIVSILSKIKGKNLILVPISMYTKGRLVKVKLALAKAKRKFEKRATIKKRDIERDIEQELKPSY